MAALPVVTSTNKGRQKKNKNANISVSTRNTNVVYCTSVFTEGNKSL